MENQQNIKTVALPHGARCSKCKTVKPITEFGKNRSTKNGVDFYCKPCRNSWRKRRRHLWNSEKSFKERNPTYHRNHRLQREYGITNKDYEVMVENQNGFCAICKTKPKTLLCVDHNHKTGEVRGLLCNDCNSGIGFLKDNISILESAIEYLRKEV